MLKIHNIYFSRLKIKMSVVGMGTIKSIYFTEHDPNRQSCSIQIKKQIFFYCWVRSACYSDAVWFVVGFRAVGSRLVGLGSAVVEWWWVQDANGLLSHVFFSIYWFIHIISKNYSYYIYTTTVTRTCPKQEVRFLKLIFKTCCG
jgi:hypothetical protein